MSGDATRAVRRAVLTQLKADAAVTALIPAARIFPPKRPAKPERPFAGYTNVIATPLRATCLDGQTVRFRVQAFDGSSADDTASNMADAIAASLDGAVLALEGGGKAHVQLLDTIVGQDGNEASSWAATLRFEATVVR